MVSTSVEETAPQLPTHFLDVLGEWGCTWMWHNLQTEGDKDWMERAIEDNSLMAVTDGSFIRELYPDLCSAAFILECTKGRVLGYDQFGHIPNANPNDPEVILWSGKQQLNAGHNGTLWSVLGF